MNATTRTLPLLLAAVLIAAPAAAQAKARSKAKPKAAAEKPAAAAPAKATPANAKLAQFQDRRSNGHFPRCTLGIELPDVPAFDAKAARVLVTKAVDDLGTDLVPEDAAKKELEPTQRGMMAKERDKTITIVFADMKNPPRKAKLLKEVSGVIELYMPRLDPNGEAAFPKLLSLAGKPLVHPALKANGVQVSLLSDAQVAVERKKAEAAARAKAKKEGETDEDSIKSSVEMALYSFPKGGESQVVLRIVDPKKAIQEIKLLDGAGEPAFAGKSEDAGFTTLEFYAAKPKPDWTMKVMMRSDKALVRQSFSFRDVPFP